MFLIGTIRTSVCWNRQIALSMITEIGELSSIWRVLGLFCRSLTTTLELESAGRAGLGSSVAWNRSAYLVVLLRNWVAIAESNP